MARPHVLWFDEAYDEPRFYLDTARRLAARAALLRRRRHLGPDQPAVAGRHARRPRRRDDRRHQRSTNPFGDIAARVGRRDPCARRRDRCSRGLIDADHRPLILPTGIGIGQGGLRDVFAGRWCPRAGRSAEGSASTAPSDRRDLDAASRGGAQGHGRDPRGRREPRRRLRGRRAASSIPPTGPIPVADRRPRRRPPTTTQLGIDELRDAWPLLDLEERGDGLRVLPREDAEEFFIALSPRDQAALLLHFRAGQRRQWMRLLEPDDVADVIQQRRRGPAARRCSRCSTRRPARRSTALLAYAEDEAGGLMSTRYARLRPQMTADEAISYLRRQARDEARDDLRRVRPRSRAAPARRGVVPRSVRRRSEDDGRRDHGDRRRPRHRRDGSGDGLARSSPSTTSTSSPSSTRTAR